MGTSNPEFLGTGLITPFRRMGSSDFMSSSGPELVRSSVRQIIGIQKGELRWRPKFGTRISKFKNKPNTEGVEHLLSDDIESSVRQHEPRATTITVAVNRRDNRLLASITWSLTSKNTAANQTLVGPDHFEVTI